MGTLYVQYCDNCERATPALPSGHWPPGWFKLFFCDLPELTLCSYQCLLDFAKKAMDNPPTTYTPLWPQDDPCPQLDGMHLERVPEGLRYQPDEARLAQQQAQDAYIKAGIEMQERRLEEGHGHVH